MYIKILEAVQMHLQVWRRCRCMEAVQIHYTSGGGADVLKFWRYCSFCSSCKCVELAQHADRHDKQCVSFIVLLHTEAVTGCPGGCRLSVR